MPFPAAVAHPLGPPTVTNTTITVDIALNQPTRITQMVMDLTQERFIGDRVFTNAGGVTGGAIIYDQVVENELYTARDVQKVAPGAEFPIVTAERKAPKVAEVEKWGGKVWQAREARRRNNVAELTNNVRKLANTVVQKVNARAVAEINTAIAAMSGATTITGHDWSAAIPNGSNPTAPGSTPLADFAAVTEFATSKKLGLLYDLVLVNPTNYTELILFFGDRLPQVLAAFGIREIYPSPDVTLGAPLFISTGNVGEMRIEEPLQTETWYEEERQRDWIQTFVLPVFAVVNPYAVVKLTGV